MAIKERERPTFMKEMNTMTTSYTEKVRRIRSTSLIAYWPLNENDGTVAWDWGKNAYNGTAASHTPADKVVYGKDGGPCYKFDGSASYVEDRKSTRLNS